MPTSQEIKTKPAQNAVRRLTSIGIKPDILVGRCPVATDQSIVRKLHRSSGISLDDIFILEDVDFVYRIPLILEELGLGKHLGKSGLNAEPDQKWPVGNSWLESMKKEKQKLLKLV